MKRASGDNWRAALAKWAIPEEILGQAPESPWIHPPALFQIPSVIASSVSHERAREVMPLGGTVLDIGCGGGIAAFALTPPASQVIGVDHQPEMLMMFSENARQRGLHSEIFEGFWPEVATEVPTADVATAHHVVYNVSLIEDFLFSMNAHASKRVILEMPQRHPLANASGLWKHFWKLERPEDPTPYDLLNVLEDLGFDAKVEFWQGEMRQESDLEQLAHYSRIRLCLPLSREHEVLDFLRNHPPSPTRNLATIWWNT